MHMKSNQIRANQHHVSFTYIFAAPRSFGDEIEAILILCIFTPGNRRRSAINSLHIKATKSIQPAMIDDSTWDDVALVHTVYGHGSAYRNTESLWDEIGPIPKPIPMSVLANKKCRKTDEKTDYIGGISIFLKLQLLQCCAYIENFAFFFQTWASVLRKLCAWNMQLITRWLRIFCCKHVVQKAEKKPIPIARYL